jgi:hypothetical protein
MVSHPSPSCYCQVLFIMIQEAIHYGLITCALLMYTQWRTISASLMYRVETVYMQGIQVLNMSTLGDVEDVNPVIKFLPHTLHRGHVCACSLCHVIYHSYDEGSWRQPLLSTARCCNVCGRNLITRLTFAASPRVDIWSNRKVGQKLGVSLPLLT